MGVPQSLPQVGARGPRGPARSSARRCAFKKRTECIKTERLRAHWSRAARDRTADFLLPPFCCCGRRRVSISAPPPAVAPSAAPRAAHRARRAPLARVRASMAQSPAAASPGAPEQGCPIRVEHDRRRRQFTVRLNGNAGPARPRLLSARRGARGALAGQVGAGARGGASPGAAEAGAGRLRSRLGPGEPAPAWPVCFPGSCRGPGERVSRHFPFPGVEWLLAAPANLRFSAQRGLEDPSRGADGLRGFGPSGAGRRGAGTGRDGVSFRPRRLWGLANLPHLCAPVSRLYSGINSWLVGRTGCPSKSEVQNSACGR